MNRFFQRAKRILPAAGAFVAVTVLLSACAKFDNENTPETPVAGLMAFNLAPDKPGIGVALSGSSLTNVPLNYTSYTGVYQRVFIGTRDVQAFEFNAGAPFATTTTTFEPSKYYSSFTVGIDSVYKNVVVQDKMDSLTVSGDEAYVRYVNAIPDSVNAAAVTITSGEKVISESANFGAVSEFTKVNSGDVTIAVKSGATGTATRTINLEKAKIYTVLLVGSATATDPEKSLQVKFITNGSITP